MMRKAVFVLLAAAAVVSAKSYTVNLFQPAVFGNVELKPGEYKVEVNEQTVVIRNGKLRGESPVKVENGDTKYDTTTVRFDSGGGKMTIQEIRLGGTKTKLILVSPSQSRP
jgi:hypothetical protein